MSWLILIVLFWKPIFYLYSYVDTKFLKKEDASKHLSELKTWFNNLFSLIRP